MEETVVVLITFFVPRGVLVEWRERKNACTTTLLLLLCSCRCRQQIRMAMDRAVSECGSLIIVFRVAMCKRNNIIVVPVTDIYHTLVVSIISSIVDLSVFALELFMTWRKWRGK